jgi:hypothetical protein
VTARRNRPTASTVKEPMTDLSRRSFLAGLVAAPVLAACGGGGDDDEAQPSTTRRSTTTSSSTTTTTPPLLAPLTGLPWALDPAQAGRPALVVKVSNADGASASHNARPQVGINDADVVAELLTEGGVTRLACIYHSTDVGEVGPVRSFRTSELDLMPGLGLPLFAYSGANSAFLARLRESGRVVDVGIDSATPAYHRVDGRARDQSLMVDPNRLRELAAGQGTPPPPWFTYRTDPAASPGAGARPSPGVGYALGGGGNAPVDYTWDGRGYARLQKGTPHTDTNGVQVAPANVVVQLTEYRDTGFRDTSGAPVPEAVLVGDGEAWVFTNGQVVQGRWWKPDPGTPTSFTDSNNQPIGLTPGKTWMAIIPPGTASIH